MKYLLTYESYVPTEKLPDLDIDLPVPSVGTKKFDTLIEDEKVIVLSDEFKPYQLYDFVVTTDGYLYIGIAHYKLASKAKKIKAAGELKINDKGKIIYLNNESGHYKPTHNHLKSIVNVFQEMNLTQPDLQVQYLY